MKKIRMSIKRASWAFALAGTLMFGASACSQGTEAGDVNVEESDFKDKSPTEHNADGQKNQSQENTGASQDTAYDAVYERQQQKTEQKGGTTTGNQGFGAAAESDKANKDNK